MKRKYANKDKGYYSQMRVEEDYFKGYVCKVEINGVDEPLIVNNGISKICIRDNGYEWFKVYPDNSNYAITIIFDNKSNLIEWYFDIAKEVGLDNNIPYEDDLYLDMIIMPNGEKIILDEDELLEALDKGEIMQFDVDLAYKTLNKLEIMYANNLNYLIELTNKFCELFGSNIRLDNN